MGELILPGLPILASGGGSGGGGLLSPDPGLIFWTVMTFLGLLFLLRKTAWGPIIDGLDRREERIKSSLSEAERSQAEAKRLVEEQQSELVKARQEAQLIIDRGNAAAKAMQEEILAKAKDESAALVDSARKEIQVETQQAREQLRTEVVDLSIQVAGKLLERTLGDADHERLAKEFLAEMDEV